MNTEMVEKIANAVLYEGYMLYPYRPSSTKNWQRWNFGTLYPETYSKATGCTEPSAMQTECLIRCGADTAISVRLRFLQLADKAGQDWQDASERNFDIPKVKVAELESDIQLEFPVAEGKKLQARIQASADQIQDGLLRLTLKVTNHSSFEEAASREKALLQSLTSAHFILSVEHGEFVSLLDPPPQYAEAAAACKNVGCYPVLVGDEGERTMMLASPIILYDYPKIAPESAGNFFDGTEIDEMLTLRVMTLTPEEQQEMRTSDERARELLERTMSIPAEQMMKLHGALRGVPKAREESE